LEVPRKCASKNENFSCLKQRPTPRVGGSRGASLWTTFVTYAPSSLSFSLARSLARSESASLSLSLPLSLLAVPAEAGGALRHAVLLCPVQNVRTSCKCRRCASLDKANAAGAA